MRSLRAITESNTNLPKHLILANTLYQGAGENRVLNHEYEPPKWGYLVCIKEGPTFPSLPDVKPTEVGRFIDENIGNIPHPLHFFRASTNGLGGVYFDLYEQCASLEYAEKLARSEFQTEILDIVNKKVIIVQP
jgi:hypothetical protein